MAVFLSVLVLLTAFVTNTFTMSVSDTSCVDNVPLCELKKEFCRNPNRTELRIHQCRKTCNACGISKFKDPFKEEPKAKKPENNNAWDEWEQMITFLYGSKCQIKPEFTPASRLLFSTQHLGFAWKLYSHVISDNEISNKNIVFSPASVSIMLAIIFEGVRNKTAAEFKKSVFKGLSRDDVRKAYVSVLNHIASRSPDSPTKFYTANMMYIDHQYKLTTEYKVLIQNCYNAKIAASKIGPGLVPKINKAVSDFTESRIPEFLDPGSLQNDMDLILLNAIYFHGLWEKPFTDGEVVSDTFYVNKSEPKNAVFMMIKGKFPYYSSPKRRRFKRAVPRHGIQILGLPYKGKEQTMFLILPRSKNGLTRLEARLKPKYLLNKLSRMEDQDVNVFIPKFTVETNLELERHLRNIGLRRLFRPKADLSGMSQMEERPLFVSNVFHKSVLEVNELGTIAGAATGMTFTDLRRQDSFMATHPFLFLIRDNPTNTILFIGRVIDPTVP